MRALTLLVVPGLCACDSGAPDRPPRADATIQDDAQVGGSGSWTRLAPVGGGPIQESATVAVDGRVYVMGGFTRDMNVVVEDVQVYDPATDTWSQAPHLPLQVHHANAAVLDGTIYVLGSLKELEFTAVDDVWAWTPGGEDGWMRRASMPVGSERGAAAVGVLDGKIVVAGGLRNGLTVADVSAYDPVADAWQPLPPLPTARDHACGASLPGQFFVIGGRTTGFAATARTVYQMTSGMSGWQEGPPMPTARGGQACAVVAGKVLVVGGEGNAGSPNGVFPQTELFDPATGIWLAEPRMLTPRHGMGAATVGRTVYVPGGATIAGFAAVRAHEAFTLAE